MVLAVGL